MEKNNYSPEEKMQQVKALYVDHLMRFHKNSPNGKYIKRSLLEVIMDSPEKDYKKILKQADYLKERAMKYFEEIERTGMNYFTKEKDLKELTSSYQERITNEFADELEINPQEFGDEIEFINHFAFELTHYKNIEFNKAS